MDTTMGAQKESSPGHLQQLPNELKQMILACLQDIFSLRSAVLTCRSLYSAFRSAETSITKRVLEGQIHPTVLSEAIARQESLSIDPLNYARVQTYIEDYYENLVDEHQWDLRSALSIAKFHRLILYYTDKFILDTGSSFPAHEFSPSQQRMPASPSEVHRIHRAFYRYEIFCNIFRTKGYLWISPFGEDFGGMRLQDIFLSKFAPWENEQLACAYAFLVDQASPAYNEVAEHDVEFGSRGIEWGVYGITEDSGYFQYLLTFGLERLKEIICAQTYAQREKLLRRLRWREQFIQRAFKRINGMRSPSGEYPASDMLGACNTWMEDLTAEEKSTYITVPFFNDPDPGPAGIWAWTRERCTPSDFVNCDNHNLMRRWGYVMWDVARLQRSEVFREEFRHPGLDFYEGRRQRERRERIRDEHRGLNNARNQIYDQGGRGWWSKDDQSRLVWVEVVKREPTRKVYTGIERKVPSLKDLGRIGLI